MTGTGLYSESLGTLSCFQASCIRGSSRPQRSLAAILRELEPTVLALRRQRLTPRTNGRAERFIQTALRYGSGLTPELTAVPINGSPLCHAGCMATTGIGPMPAWLVSHPSPD